MNLCDFLWIVVFPCEFDEKPKKRTEVQQNRKNEDKTTKRKKQSETIQFCFSSFKLLWFLVSWLAFPWVGQMSCELPDFPWKSPSRHACGGLQVGGCAGDTGKRRGQERQMGQVGPQVFAVPNFDAQTRTWPCIRCCGEQSSSAAARQRKALCRYGNMQERAWGLWVLLVQRLCVWSCTARCLLTLLEIDSRVAYRGTSVIGWRG